MKKQVQGIKALYVSPCEGGAIVYCLRGGGAEEVWKIDASALESAVNALGVLPENAAPPRRHLTPRELDVLKLLGKGDTNSEIATALALSVNTVKDHIHQILAKLGVKNRAQAAVWAQQLDLLQGRSPRVFL